MKVRLVVHEGRQDVSGFAHQFIESADRAGLSVIADEAMAKTVGADVANTGIPDMVVAVGGDGTMLAAVQVALAHGVPLFGFNLGTIGFLTEVEPDDLEMVVNALAEGSFTTVSRMGITAALNGNSVSGLNDVVVEKIDTLRLVQLEVEVDGEPFVTYRADGLIVATPTGSTAYSFSAGGPLVDHSIEAILLTPVASHSLFARTMVLSPDATIRVTVNRERPVRVSVDKERLGEADTGEVVEITRSADPIRFVRFGPHSFPRAVTEKFRLG
jgi:NAD+ kinase